MHVGSTASRVGRIAAIVGSLAMCLGLGLFGLGHDLPRAATSDTRFLFLAGKYWLAGIDAYVPTQALDAGPLGDVYARYVMAYPPQTAPLCMLLALGAIDLATALMDVLNLAALAVLAWVAVATIEETVDPAVSTAQRWWVPALVVGNLATAFVLYIGQTTLVVAAALAACWYCARRGRDVAAGLLLAFASIKPPLALFVALWFALDRRWRLLAATTITVLLLALGPMFMLGPLGALRAWLVGVANYAAAPQNALGSRMVFNLQAFLLTLGIATPNLLVLGVAATIALFAFRTRLAERDLLGVLVGLGLVFGYGHGYDLAALVVLVPAFWCRLRERPGAAGVALALLVGISFPNSLLERLGSPVVLHARVLLVMAALAWLVVLGATERAAAADGAQLEDAAEVAPPWVPSTSRMP
jgi:hypothetical protein